MSKIKELPIQVRQRNKRGRPTNYELRISQIMSKIMNTPKMKKLMSDKVFEEYAYGYSTITDQEIEQALDFPITPKKEKKG